ncbi:Mrp/NBP35 family ATP-binding protein [Nitrospira moscoviensis]|jgi:ATP-binding protein involved in chromosome partitioning|uniref:Iron-sulfur cluster carrier protein n=1 Tax=Nitrospira moscoviensis TaxID=42253 RepID=A0A0K2GGU8_NITMO|nr:Mrp/NBP35 family ATP-binding protein [Nitrospira moscoviensis]ALA60069.1 Cytosolic Fe-S cluster assembly factor NUBP1-like protein [Nitrospira moscoviensis]
MGRELNVISGGNGGGSDACTYMWACAICDENERCQKDKEGHSRWLVAKRMERIEYKVLVMSNKGGVGKSTMTTNLAVSLALKGWHVGICDMDIHGPNIPKMVGAEGQKLKISTSGGIIPFQAYNLKIASMSFLLQNPDDPIIWRDAYKYEFINQLLGGVEWQDLNFLLIDLPPGTGNESVTTIDLLGNVSGAVIVTTPQEVALLDSRKSVTFCKDSEVPIIGIVENMSGLECPHCHQHIEVFRKGGGEASAHDMGVPFLGRIPLDPDVVTQSDAGEPFAMFYSDTPTAEAYHQIANQVEAFCKKSGSLLKVGPRPQHQH